MELNPFKKKDKTQTKEYKQQSTELAKETPATEDIVVSQHPENVQPKVQEISLEDAIINNTDTWYKAQVLGLLIEIRDAIKGKE